MHFSRSFQALVCGFGMVWLPVSTASAQAAAGVAGEPVLTSESGLKDPAEARAIETFFEGSGKGGFFSGKDGVQIAYRSFVQRDKAGEKGAVVIVSGRTESLLKYKETVFDLWRAGYSVYVHDHRGQGLSQREAAVRETPEKGHVGDFQAYVDDLRQFVGSEVRAGQHARHYLLGHSMGGAVTALFLEEATPEAGLFKAAVLSSPMLQIKGIAGVNASTLSCRFARAQVWRGNATDYIVSGGGYAPKKFSDNEYTRSEVRYERLLQQVADAPQIRLGSPTHGWFANACDAAEKARGQSDRIRQPVMVLVAGDDGIVDGDGPAEFCRGLAGAARARGCDGQGGGPVTIPGALHELMIERDTQRSPALQRVLQFYASQP